MLSSQQRSATHNRADEFATTRRACVGRPIAPKMVSITTARRRVSRRLVGVMFAAVAFSFAAAPTSAFADHSPTEIIDGYVPVSDGTTLRMQVEYPTDRPDEGLPTVLIYNGYGHSLGPSHAGTFRDWAAHNGYALMVVSVRGTGCSGGSWDFLSEQEATDGRDVINWITQQKAWSNGTVAMIGDSYSGFQMLPVAALKPKPEGLVAIAPGQPIADFYRDVAYPGGISNTFLGAAFSATILQGSTTIAADTATRLPEPNSQECAENQIGVPVAPLGTPAALFAARRWDDGAIYDRAPARNITGIDVPTFTTVAWQDETVGSRAIVDLPKVSGPFHAVLSNGGHGWSNGVWYADRLQDRLKQFLDFYVRGVDTKGPTGVPFSALPAIEIWWESARGADPDGGWSRTSIEPRWTTGLSRVPAAPERETTLFLSSDRKLTRGPGSGAPDRYEYVGGTGQYHYEGTATCAPLVECVATPLTPAAWSDPPVPGKSLVYTSAPLEKDLVVFGSGSLDLWLDSTATDTDLQAVLTEVRPTEADPDEQQQEMYVQAGWLRASHRKLDDGRSAPTRPFHTHQMNDTRPLIPLRPELMRVEMRPFAHVFRAGSRVRLFIEAPPAKSGNWSFESLPGPAVNRVYHDATHPSALRLATLPGHTAPLRHAKCGEVIRQPCRATTVAGAAGNTIAAPAG